MSRRVQVDASFEVHATGCQRGYTYPTETRTPLESRATSAMIASPGKCSGWPEWTMAGSSEAAFAGVRSANASSGRSTDAALPRSRPRTGGPGGGPATTDGGPEDGIGVTGAAPQAAIRLRTVLRPSAAALRRRSNGICADLLVVTTMDGY